MIELYVADVSALPDPLEHPEEMEGLPEERRQKIEKQKHLRNRRQSLGAGRLLAEACEKHNVSMNEIRIGEHGKPEIEGFYFNLSHSGDYAICAVADAPVGCDIEQVRKPYDEAFIRLWAVKESYMKMTGEGMRVPVDSIEIVFSEEEIRVKRDGKMQSCFVKEYEVPGYRVAVCSEGAPV